MEQSADQAKSPEELREDIEQTREQLGDTVEALAEKTDVKTQTTDLGSQRRCPAEKGRVRLPGQAVNADSASGGVQQAAATVRQEPVPFTAAGA